MIDDLKDRNRQIFRNIMVLSVGAGCAKFLDILSIPFVARIFSPEELGILSVFVSALLVAAPFATFGFSTALPLPRRDGTAINLAVISFILLLFSVSIISLLLGFFAQPICRIFSVPSLVNYWWLFPIGMAAAGVYEILNLWGTRVRTFRLLSFSKVGQSSSSTIIKLGMGVAGFGFFALLFGHVVGLIVSMVILLKFFLGELARLRGSLSLRRSLCVIKHYGEFPKYRFPSQLLLVFSMQAPLLFSAWIFGAEVTGQLGLSLMALALPISLFGQTSGQAYYSEIAKLGCRNSALILSLTRSLIIKLLAFSIPFFLVLVIFGEWIFPFVFGVEWALAGRFSRVLAIYLLFQFLSAPLVNVFSVYGMQKKFFFINLRRVVVLLCVFICSKYFNMSPLNTVSLYSFILSFHYLIICIEVFSVVKKNIA